MTNELPQIYCDMDQVLVNFVGGANKVLAAAGLKPFPEEEKNAKWEAMKQIPKFWANLEPMSDAMTLWRSEVGLTLSAVMRSCTDCS